jgi:hypothetical protein
MPRKENPYRLANVEQRAARCSSFEIPSRREREDLWPGDLARLIFEDIGERLWVKVTEVLAGHVCTGVIVSLPLDNAVHKGDKICFSPENVAGILNPGESAMN